MGTGVNLLAPPRQELAELGRDLPTPAIAKRLGVSAGCAGSPRPPHTAVRVVKEPTQRGR